MTDRATWPDRRLCDLFGIAHPFVQAPIAGSATPALAAAGSNAGGLGSLVCAEMTGGHLRSAVTALRGLTNGPFNLNFFVNPAPLTTPDVLERTRDRLRPYYRERGLTMPEGPSPPNGPSFDAGKLSLLLALSPRVASFHFGLPEAGMVDRLKTAGIVVISTATTVAEAQALAAGGMDAVIAQGWEAGGHRGAHMPPGLGDGVGTLALVPQIADAVDVPVIAAGGIGDGRGSRRLLPWGRQVSRWGRPFCRRMRPELTPRVAPCCAGPRTATP